MAALRLAPGFGAVDAHLFDGLHHSPFCDGRRAYGRLRRADFNRQRSDQSRLDCRNDPARDLVGRFLGTSDGQDGRFVVENYHHYGWASFSLVLVAACICIQGSRQFIPRLIEVARRGAPTPGFLGLVRDTIDTLKNSNFRRVIVLEIAVGGSMGILGALNMIAWTYFWELTVGQIATLSIAALIAVALMFPGINLLSGSLGEAVPIETRGDRARLQYPLVGAGPAARNSSR